MSVGSISSALPATPAYQPAANNALTQAAAAAELEQSAASAAAVEALSQNSAALSTTLVDISV